MRDHVVERRRRSSRVHRRAGRRRLPAVRRAASRSRSTTSRRAFVDSVGTGATLVVLALGPTAFDDKALQSAKVEVPPNTTVVWLIAVPRSRQPTAAAGPRSPAPATARPAADRNCGGCNWLVTITPSIMSPTMAAHGRPLSCTATTAPLATRRSERSTPTIRGGQRKLGATNPRRRTSRPIVRAAWAKSREVLLTGMGSVSRRGVTAGL